MLERRGISMVNLYAFLSDGLFWVDLVVLSQMEVGLGERWIDLEEEEGG